MTLPKKAFTKAVRNEANIVKILTNQKRALELELVAVFLSAAV